MRDWNEIIQNAIIIAMSSAVLGFIAMLMRDIVLSFFKRSAKKNLK